MNDPGHLFQTAHDQLFSWCKQHDFAGHDPFDALNSRFFQATPLVRSRNARLIWTQILKRSPADVRGLVGVPPERNAKGIALFALAQIANHRRTQSTETAKQAQELIATLLSMKAAGYSGAAWGYNFDWQSRNFYARRNTPTIVPTAFAARAFIEASIAFQRDDYLDVARSVCTFILQDLPRPFDTETELCFSYAPNSDTRIFNATLLAAEVLACVGKLTGEAQLCVAAKRATQYVINNQRPDGSWYYGTDPKQSWIDNFHTSYILVSLKRIIAASSPTPDFQTALERGYHYWKSNFFLAEGWPKYYHDDPYPADAHAAASAVVAFLECAGLDKDALKLARTVASWTLQNLRDKRGFFYYQRRRFYTVRKPYMRWTQAWMLYALACLLEEETD